MIQTAGNNSLGGTVVATADAKALPLPTARLEALAESFRQGGLLLAVHSAAGGIVYHDEQTSAFLARYVLPLLREQSFPITIDASVQARIIRMPGAVCVAWPWLERRRLRATFVLAGRAESFTLDEDVVRACGRLQLDATWLLSQAHQLPGYGEAAILLQGRLLPDILRDQITLEGLERERDSLSTQLAHTYEELSLIYQISGGMKVNRRAPEFFRQASLDVLDVLNVRAMGYGLKGDLLLQPAGPETCGPLQLAPEKTERLSEELMSVLSNRRGELLINDLASDSSFNWLAGDARQLLAVPLQRQEQVLGCLFALDKQEGEFNSVDSKLLSSIANEAAIYLENARLFEDVHGLMMGLLHSLTSAVDAKDTYTCGHSQRVALVSRHIARQIGLGERDIEQVYMAGLLHDVGKIGVPEAVLQKPGRLTPEEFELIKRHPEIGARILQDVKQIQGIIPGVLHHHERYDGKGYPGGLAGEAIPLMGRIICLADCFDAMTSSRTYRKGLPLEVAMTEIRRCSGTQFDPRLSEVFLQMTPDGLRELLRDYQQKPADLHTLQESIRSST